MSLDKSAREQLKQFVEALENLDGEKKELSQEIAEKWKEVKSAGFDKAALRNVLKLRKMREHERIQHEELMDLYQHALGMTPIEEAIANLDASGAESTLTDSDGTVLAKFGGKKPARPRETVN